MVEEYPLVDVRINPVFAALIENDLKAEDVPAQYLNMAELYIGAIHEDHEHDIYRYSQQQKLLCGFQWAEQQVSRF